MQVISRASKGVAASLAEVQRDLQEQSRKNTNGFFPIHNAPTPLTERSASNQGFHDAGNY